MRLARLEERQEGLENKIDRNHQEAQEWRTNVMAILQKLTRETVAFQGLIDQAKGARWLAGLLVTMGVALAGVGAKVFLEWLTGHH